MDDFNLFSLAVQNKFNEMSKDELFVTDVDGDVLFENYLKAYPEGTNPVFRTRTTYDCQCCKQFIRNLGRLVTIKNGKLTSIWSDLDVPAPFKQVAETLDGYIQSYPIKSVYRTKEKQYGKGHNYDPKTNQRYDHFCGTVAARHCFEDPETKRGEQDAIFQVMRRGLIEIRPTDLDDVIELVESNGLYRGEEHKAALIGFRDLQRRQLASSNMTLFVWEHLADRNARFRNTVIGTMLVEMAEGKELEQAVKAFEVKVAPANYKRPTAIITQKMVEQAVETMTTLGLHGALARRYARMSDVSVNDVLFVDNESKSKMKDGITLLLEGNVKKSVPDLKHATRKRAEEFIEDIKLAGAKTLEVFVENRHKGNFVSLTGADGPERLFRWNNNFAWSYDGDVTDSVKERVKAAGGKIDCKLRVSLSWFNGDDLDLHALTPDRTHVSYANKYGILDVDMNAGGPRSRSPVENLAFNDLENGIYTIWVNQFAQRETIDVGFAIEVEFAGSIQQYSYPKALKNRNDIECFKLHVQNGVLTKVETELTGGMISQEKWGVKTETLVPVTALMYSPNHWGDNSVGAKHLIFALKDCKNPGSTRGIYNEFLRPDLEKHRKVFEVLGNKTKCAASDEQISGVGFTAARGDTVTVVVDGKRAYVLMF